MKASKLLACCVAVGAMSLSAMAQDKGQPPKDGGRPERTRPERPEGAPRGGGGEQLSAEKAKAAWEAEANGVAKRLSLNADQTKALVKAYTDARTSHNEAAEKMRKEMMDKRDKNKDKEPDAESMRAMGAEMMKARDELNKNEREKFQKALGSSLNADQTTKAVGSLGTFNPQWDNMADAILGFKLEAAKQQTALEAVEDYVVALSKARPAAGADGDREAARTAMQDAREKLSTSMKKVLTDEQFKKFEESARGFGGRRPGGPGGGGRRGEGGPGGGGGG